MQSAIVYFVMFMVWATPLRFQQKLSGESELEANERYEAIARDVFSISFEVSEKPLSVYVKGGDKVNGTVQDNHARIQTGLWLLAQAKCETEYRKRVDIGQCKTWECDRRQAWGLWQIHAGDGLTLEGPGFRKYNDRPKTWQGIVYDGMTLAIDRRSGVRMALHMRRVSATFWTTSSCAESLRKKWIQKEPFSSSALESTMVVK